MEIQSAKSRVQEMLQDQQLISPTNKLLDVKTRAEEGEPTHWKDLRDISTNWNVWALLCPGLFFKTFIYKLWDNVAECSQFREPVCWKEGD